MQNKLLATLFVVASTFVSVQSDAADLFRIGKYVRDTKSPEFPEGGRESGLLDVIRSTPNAASFSLEATMNPISDDDGFHTRNGVIEAGEMTGQGKSALYQSNKDKSLGVCSLRFTQSDDSILVVQTGKCWWFGEGVNASGRYIPARGGKVHFVR